ncbi:alpha-L-rhamnosidase C-terminal domain-containing protein [Erysipelotrichaceae bacterium 51-3]
MVLRSLGGIQIDKNAVGFDSIRVAPYFSKQINEVCCSIDTIHGRIESNWKRVDGKITWLLRVPSAIHYEILGDYDSSVELILLPA